MPDAASVPRYFFSASRVAPRKRMSAARSRDRGDRPKACCGWRRARRSSCRERLRSTKRCRAPEMRAIASWRRRSVGRGRRRRRRAIAQQRGDRDAARGAGNALPIKVRTRPTVTSGARSPGPRAPIAFSTSISASPLRPGRVLGRIEPVEQAGAGRRPGHFVSDTLVASWRASSGMASPNAA